ncbi:MAG: hypothetical protein IM644_09215 [Phenylobacterium sp.]|uniref:hypothetical protein n=1 Tax=Phenylobacterium sp. TaxID=1871053 RepID=UPI0025EA752D|nr:hypothetical protein [Phenylobacterium sp.]MCA6232448.1 hypothetical protein [Phenylobacterium sp.]
MLFPTRKANQKAGAFQRGVRNQEAENRALGTFWNSDDAIAATVHTRQDLVLIYSMLYSCHEQLVKISRGVWFIALCVVMLTFTNCMIATK